MAIRLNVEFSPGSAARVVQTWFVEMRTPRTDPVDGFERRSGFWIELRDVADRVVYRRVMADPRGQLEGPADQHGRIVTVSDDPRPQLLSIVVPELPGASRFAIVAQVTFGPVNPVLIVDLPRRN